MMRFTEFNPIDELIDPSLKDKKGFTKIKHDELGLTYTAWSRGDTDLDIEVKTPGGEIIAHALFRDNEHPDDLTSDDTWVDKKYRRMGIATKMYNFAQELGNTVLPSKYRSAAAKKFWKTRT